MLKVKTYKNWKEICEAMGWKTTGGNIKKKNLQVLDSLCEYIKDGNKFIVTNIFDEPKEIIDKRKRKESSGLTKDLEYAILKILLNQNEKSLSISRTYLMSLVGLINSENYYIINNIREKYAKDKGMDTKTVNIILDRIYVYANNYIMRAIKNLEKKMLVHVIKDVPYVNVTDRVVITDALNRPNHIEETTHSREATKDEVKFILKTKKEVLAEFGYGEHDKVAFKDRRNIAKMVNKRLKKEIGIHYTYNAFRFITNDEYLQQSLDILAQEIDKDYMNDVNEDFIKILNKSFTDKQSKSIKRHEELNSILNSLTEEFLFSEEEDKEKISKEYGETEKEFYKTKMFLDENFQLSAFLIVNDVVNLKANKYEYISEVISDIKDFDSEFEW